MTVFVCLAGFVGLPAYYAFSIYYDPYFHPRQTGGDWIWREDGKTWLYGGESDEEHFDITEFRLNPDWLEYGLGREAFAAVYAPVFQSVEEVDGVIGEDWEVIVASRGGDTKVYVKDWLRRYEVVNDRLDGEPACVVYCLLADLAAVYQREIDGRELEFAASGYTYFDPFTMWGYSAFVLWDRETESLWWPPINKAVSGPMVDTRMPFFERDTWHRTTWRKAREAYPDARVFVRNQPPEALTPRG